MILNTKNVHFIDAIRSLRPNSTWSLVGDDFSNIKWMDTNFSCPTVDEINNEIQRLQKEYDDRDYIRQRKNSYPSIQDQLDMLYWDKINGTDNWKNVISNIKSKFPKNNT
jgi:hypothetical protein